MSRKPNCAIQKTRLATHFLTVVMAATIIAIHLSGYGQNDKDPLMKKKADKAANTLSISLKLHLPPDSAGKTCAWAIAAPGKVLADGAFEIASSSGTMMHIISNAEKSIPDGEFDLWVTIHNDDRIAPYPSFGDEFATKTLSVKRGSGSIEIKKADWQVRRLSNPKNRLVIHYHRYDDNYADATLWTWDANRNRTPDNAELYPIGMDNYGLIFELDVEDYGLDNLNDQIGILPRFNKDWNKKDGADRHWRTSMPPEVWLIGGRTETFIERPNTNPHIGMAFLDGRNEITLVLSHPVRMGTIGPADVRIKTDKGRALEIDSIELLPPFDSGKTRRVQIRTKEEITTPSLKLHAELKGYSGTEVVARKILSDKELYYDGKVKLGAVWSKSKTDFRLFAPTANGVTLVLSPHPRGDKDIETHPMKLRSKGIWEVSVKGDLHGTYFTYLINAPGLDPNFEVVDPYAMGRAGDDGRGIVVDMKRTDPPGFDPAKRPPMINTTDAIIYETHMRGMTIDENSGVEHKGKYLGMADPMAHHPADPAAKTGLAHVKELGITHIQVMPIQDFDNIEPSEEYNWGYMTVNFNYPDGMYATSVNDLSRITELKTFIKACHDAGLRVILDVVYNHTSPPAPFEKIIPMYYHRTTDDGNFWNGSGCGNEFDSEQPMASRFIVDSCRFWVEEYGVDGFRFDLLGLIDLDTMLKVRDAVQEVDPTILVYGEPWAAAPSGVGQITDKKRLRTSGIGAFNDHFRNAVKGDTRGAGTGYVQTGSERGGLISGLQASINDWSWTPIEVIQYITAHDDLCLQDKLVASQPDASEARLKAMQKMALGCVLVAQGIPFIYSGEDIFRTKQGIDNTYNAGDDVNKIHWDWKIANRDVFDYTQGMIELRKAHPVFRLPTSDEIKKRVSFPANALPTPSAILMRLDGRGIEDESAKEILVLFNPEKRALEFALPEGEWLVIADENKTGAAPLRTAQGKTSVAATSIQVLLLPKKAATAKSQ